jgi:RNA polymerase sigma-70 factor (ECF subfamily)
MSLLEASVGSGAVSDILTPVNLARHVERRRRIKRGEEMSGLRLPIRRNATGVNALSDIDLLALAGEGDADAFEVIYDRHAPAAFSLATRICRDPVLAEDVVQDAFLSLWRKRDRYDAARGQFRSWLLGIVHNSAIDKLRRGAVHERRRASAEGIEDRLEASDRTDEEVTQREEATEVRGALSSLPEDQRRVIELAYFDGLTHTQIAARLEQPVGTVKGRMRLGLAKLRGQLSGELTEEATR